jgi:hypothetical protein
MRKVAQLIKDVADCSPTNEVTIDLNQYLNKVKVSKTLIAQADDLACEHERFHTNYVIGGRLALYELLGKIYDLALKVEKSSDREFFVTQMRKALKKKYGIKTQENSTTAAIVVRYVTRVDRKTTHVYAQAIEAAKASKIPTVCFSGYLEEQGGVEKIRSTQAKSKKPMQQKPCVSSGAGLEASSVLDYLRSRTEFPKATFLFKSEIEQDEDCEFSVFVCAKRQGRYLVLDQLDLPEDIDLRNLLESGLKLQLERYSSNPKRFDQKAAQRSSKRSLAIVRKRNPGHYQAILSAIKNKSTDHLGSSAKRAWISSQITANSAS